MVVNECVILLRNVQGDKSRRKYNDGAETLILDYLFELQVPKVKIKATVFRDIHIILYGWEYSICTE
jgi:hypothetical protein